METKTLSWAAAHAGRPPGAALLHLLAAVLRTAGDAVDRLAVRLGTASAAVAPTAQVVEFHPLHRDAGAPEGALYVDGKLVGVITGVTRL